VGRIVHVYCRAVSGRWTPYRPSPLGGVVLSELRGAGMTSDQTEVTALLGPCGVSAACSFLLEQACLAAPLPVPPGGRDGGEIVCLLSVVRLRRREGPWLTLALASGLVHLAQLGLGRSGFR
jgi:hypothetical protein